MVDHVVHEPRADVAVHGRLEGAVGLPKGFDFAKGLLTRFDADPVQEFVEVDVGERGRRLRDLSGAHARTPGEVAAELPVVHRLVSGEVALELSLVGSIVDIVCHEAGLLHEQARVRPGAGFGTTGEGAHFPNGLGEVAAELRPAQQNRLVRVGALARERPAALGTAGCENLLYDRVDVRHRTSLASVPIILGLAGAFGSVKMDARVISVCVRDQNGRSCDGVLAPVGAPDSQTPC